MRRYWRVVKAMLNERRKEKILNAGLWGRVKTKEKP